MAPELPYKLLFFSAFMLTVSALVVFSTKEEFAYETPDAPGSDGIFDKIVEAYDAMTGLVFDVATFNIDGAPWWVRFPMSLVMVAPWVYIILVLIVENIPFFA